MFFRLINLQNWYLAHKARMLLLLPKRLQAFGFRNKNSHDHRVLYSQHNEIFVNYFDW